MEMSPSLLVGIERAILSAIVFEPEIFSDISNKLQSKDFYLPFHQYIFDAMVELEKEDKPIDEEFLKRKLTKKERFDDVAMLEVLTATPITNYEAYIEEIKEEKTKRELKKLGLVINKHLEDGKSSNEILSILLNSAEELSISSENIKKTKMNDIEAKEPEFYIKGVGFTLLSLKENQLTSF